MTAKKALLYARYERITMKGRSKISPDFSFCEMASRPNKIEAARRNGILSLLLSAIMVVNPACRSRLPSPSQGPGREPQKVEAPQKVEQVEESTDELNQAFFAAVENGLEDEVMRLISQGADVNVKDAQGKTALFYAVKHSHKNIVELLIAKGADVNAKEDGGYTPLYYALWPGNKDLTTLLISKGAEVNVEPEEDYPLIYYAVWNEDLDTVKLLVAKGAKFDVKILEDRTAFHYAVGQGSRDIAEFLVSKGIDTSTFHVAAGMGDLARVKNHIEQGADVNTQDELGWTPLYWAASLGQIEVAKLLIDKGADVRTAATDGGIALYQAAQAGDNEVVELLIANGAEIDAKGMGGWTSLHRAVQSGHREVVQLLLANGAEIDAKGMGGWTPLHCAVQSGHREVVQLLLANGADVNAKDSRDRTPLFLALRRGRKEVLPLLLAHGADVNAKNRTGITPLDLAIGSEDIEIIELFLHDKANISAVLSSFVQSGDKKVVEHIIGLGVDVNVKDKHGLTPLHYAVRSENPSKDITAFLIDNGADVDAADEYGLTPLHYATKQGHINIAELLIAQGAPLDIKDSAGRAPIHYAAEATYGATKPQKWSLGMVRLLMDAGADINVQDDIGWMPLHYAAYHFKKYLVEVLVERGADVDIVDNRGRTPFVVVQERLIHLETMRGSQFESTVTQALKRDLRKVSREISKLLYKNGCIYVVTPDGKDASAGTNESPLRTIAAAIEVVEPGDTIVVRGGTYVCSRTIHIDKSGEQGNPIRLVAYPGEVPVLDFAEAKGDSVFISGAYWHIKGLAITRARRPIQIHGSGAHHNILEQVSAFANQFSGIHLTTDGPAHNIILNCDSYRNFDPQYNGQSADGFGVAWNVGRGNILIGDRSWNNSDDGYDLGRNKNIVRLERCYSWSNGVNIWNHPFFVGNANGFKLGGGGGRHVLISCLAWGHSLSGATLNGNTSGVVFRNCTFWDNDTNYFFEWTGWLKEAREGCVFSNNISYNGHSRDKINPGANSQFNSWDADLGLTLTDDDFLSLDDSAMTQPRNPDGSIPQNNFLKLAPGSAAIDSGADIGMPFVGKRPDLGAFEYDPNKPGQGYVKMLHQYVRDRDIKKIKELLTQGEDINDKDWLGYTPLQWAVYFGYPDLVGLLISKGADPDIQSDTGRYALEIARAMAYPELEALLRKLGAKAGDVSTN